MRIHSIKPLRISTPDGPRFISPATVAHLCGVSLRRLRGEMQQATLPLE